jgi:hypothetical protein
VSGVGERAGETENPYVAFQELSGRKLVSPGRAGDDAMSSSRLLEEWGEPDSRDECPDGSECWRYNGFVRWAGVVVIVFVPIPLVVPTGLEHVDFTVRDDRVVRAHSSANHESWGWTCGWAPPFMHGGGFFAGSTGSRSDTFCNPFE